MRIEYGGEQFVTLSALRRKKKLCLFEEKIQSGAKGKSMETILARSFISDQRIQLVLVV